jgi:dihydrofolate synthase/folylpolyglutamate synthase
VPSNFLLYLESVQRFGIRPGLERIRDLLQRAQVLLPSGAPAFPAVLVGGTNGKGSTAQFLAFLLARDPRRIGLYTSPHLHAWNERIRIASEQSGAFSAAKISDSDLEAAFQQARPLLDEVARGEHGQPTEFEVLTLLGLSHFAWKNVDAAVVEVGLGGKWDATNAIDPRVSVITHVALDHCDRLGSTHEEIAADKIHIARPGRVLVTAEDKPPVLEVFRAHCDQVGALLWPFRAPQFSNDTSRLVEVWKEVSRLPLPDSPAFQRLNLQTARVAHTAFCLEVGWEIEDESGAQWQVLAGVPGRLEPVRDSPRVYLDGANNPDGALALSHELQRMLSEIPDARLHLIFGASGDKDARAMLQVLAPLAHVLTLSQASHTRAAPVEDLAAVARELGAQVLVEPDVNRAIERAIQGAREQDIVCVCGSFFLLGDVDRARMGNY